MAQRAEGVSSLSLESFDNSALLDPKQGKLFGHVVDAKLHWRDQMLRRIYEFEKNSKTTTDFFREYTKFFIRKLSTLHVIDAEKKHRSPQAFYARPERAIAKLKEDRNIVLPVVSISIDDMEEDVERRRAEFNVHLETAWDETEQRAIRVASLAPKAMNIIYGINLYTKYVEDANQLTEQIQLMFNPGLNVRTKFSDQIKAYLSDISDNSTLDLADQEDRIIKRRVEIVVEAYIPTRKYLVTSTGEIELISQEFIIDELQL